MYSISGLTYVSKVASLGTFTAAAIECGVKQPTVSAAIADIEADLGVTLFMRSSRKLSLTPAGHKLLPKINLVLEALEELHARAGAVVLPVQPVLRLGFTPLVGAKRLSMLLDPYRQSHPSVHLSFHESSIAELDERLDKGSLDIIFGIGFRLSKQRRKAALFKDALYYCAPMRSAQIPGSVVMREIARHNLLLTEDLCGLAGATRTLLAADSLKVNEYTGRAMSYGALEDWAELGLGGAVIPGVHLRDKRRAVAVVDSNGDSVVINQEALWRKDLMNSEHARTMVRHLHLTVPRLANGFGWHV
jgi:DNA-binding transcriptional LysR family regulator